MSWLSVLLSLLAALTVSGQTYPDTTAGGRRGMAEIIDSMDGGSLGGEQWRQGHLQNDQRMLQDFGRVLPGMGVLLATRELRTGTDLLGQRRSLDDQMFNVLTLVGGAAGVHGAGPPSGVGDMWQARRMADIAPSGNPFQHVFRQMDDVLAICSSNCFVAGTRVVTNISREGLDTRPIEELSLGDRVAASNPLRGETSSPSQVDPRTWRTVRLEAHEAGVPYEIALLRPVDWIREHGAQPGARLYLALEEIGMRGVATVTAVGPCPEIEPEDGMQRRVVTATMVHPAPGIVDLQIEGEQDPVGVTAIHPIWSEDRGSFVPAGSLRPGESLKTLDGTLLQVTRITPRRGPPQVVYNLEVDAEHVYGVSARGLVVHNTCPRGVTISPGLYRTGNTTGPSPIRVPRDITPDINNMVHFSDPANGLSVMDSPDRLITRGLIWTIPAGQSLPNGLIATPDIPFRSHFNIQPARTMTFDEYRQLLSEIMWSTTGTRM